MARDTASFFSALVPTLSFFELDGRKRGAAGEDEEQGEQGDHVCVGELAADVVHDDPSES
ncbi:MAG: hypothetical protein U0R71_16460 [Solirubrobacterales bacterium]